MVNRSMYRPAVTALSGYVPGATASGKFIKLNTNENPHPPPQPVVDAIKKQLMALLIVTLMPPHVHFDVLQRRH